VNDPVRRDARPLIPIPASPLEPHDSAPRPRPRLLILVVAYYAETTLVRLLERIPASVFSRYDCQVLVVDDGSKDRTFEIGLEYRRAHPELPVVVLRNEFNQGYGGNQKVGYAYAIAERFDFVAMLHGDGQYAVAGC
jgi:glycosyltransferase involved in cell wall biosynthesis